MQYRPIPNRVPKAALTRTCMSRYRLTRSAASSSFRHDVDLTESNQPEKTMSQVESLDEHEDREDENKSCQCQRPKNGPQIAKVVQSSGRLRHDPYGQRRRGSSRRGALFPIPLRQTWARRGCAQVGKFAPNFLQAVGRKA